MLGICFHNCDVFNPARDMIVSAWSANSWEETIFFFQCISRMGGGKNIHQEIKEKDKQNLKKHCERLLLHWFYIWYLLKQSRALTQFVKSNKISAITH